VVSNKLDGEFVTTSNVTKMEYFPYTSISTYTKYKVDMYKVAAVGKPVRFVSNNSSPSKLVTCKVMAVNQTILINGYQTTGLAWIGECNSKGYKGDSGGMIAFDLSPSQGVTDIYPAGIIIGGDKPDGSTNIIMEPTYELFAYLTLTYH